MEEWMGIDIRACVREAGRSGRVDGDWHRSMCEKGRQKWKSGWGLTLEHV